MTIVDDLHEAEERLLKELRRLRQGARSIVGADKPDYQLTLGQRIADQVAATMGSWPFIIIQTCILAVWIVLNVTAFVERKPELAQEIIKRDKEVDQINKQLARELTSFML